MRKEFLGKTVLAATIFGSTVFGGCSEGDSNTAAINSGTDSNINQHNSEDNPSQNEDLSPQVNVRFVTSSPEINQMVSEGLDVGEMVERLKTEGNGLVIVRVGGLKSSDQVVLKMQDIDYHGDVIEGSDQVVTLGGADEDSHGVKISLFLAQNCRMGMHRIQASVDGGESFSNIEVFEEKINPEIFALDRDACFSTIDLAPKYGSSGLI